MMHTVSSNVGWANAHAAAKAATNNANNTNSPRLGGNVAWRIARQARCDSPGSGAI
jgi:hypothetical protein